MKLWIILVVAGLISGSAQQPQRLKQAHAKPKPHGQRASQYPTIAKQTVEQMNAAGLKPDVDKIDAVYPLLSVEGLTITAEHTLVASRIGFQKFKRIGFDPSKVTDKSVQRELQRLREFIGRKNAFGSTLQVMPTRGYKPSTNALPVHHGGGLPREMRPQPAKPPLPTQL